MKEVFNYRYWILTALVGAAIVLLITDCSENATIGEWLEYHFTHKISGLAICGVFLYLFEKWNDSDKIPFFDGIAKKSDEVVNK